MSVFVQPFCVDCAEVEFDRLELLNDALPEGEQMSRSELRFRAQRASVMVGFLDERVCRRCELLDVRPDHAPKFVPLENLFPNREARRSFERRVRSATLVSEGGIR